MSYYTSASSQSEAVGRQLRVTRTVFGPEALDVKGTLVGDGLETLGALEAAGAERPVQAYSYYIKGELPGGHWLYRQIPVRVRVEGSEYVAEQPQLALHAFGESPVDAVLNLREELAEHYSRLEELGDRLAAPLMRQRDFLRKLLTSPDA